MHRAEFFEAYQRWAERAREIAHLKYLLGEVPSIDFEVRDAIGFNGEGAVLAAVEPRHWEEGDEAVAIVISWDELDDYHVTVKRLKAAVERKKREQAEATQRAKREQFERLRRELGER